MTLPDNLVTIHPYFRARPGQLEAFKAMLPQFVERTAGEEACSFYEFTLHGDEIFCREGYAGAEGVLRHLENVGDLLQEALGISELTRLELHGPAEELDKLRGPLADLNPLWFERACGFRR